MADANAKSTEQILETIDQLRKRKARPDLDRICHMVERRYGRNPSQTQAEIERLVDAEIVIKVDYKGSTSYRNAAKWGKKHTLSGQILNSNDVSRSLIDAVRFCCHQQHQHGVNVKDIEGYLTSKNIGTKLVKTKLQVALEREVVANQLLKLSNGNFIVPSTEKKSEETAVVVVNTPAVNDVVTAAAVAVVAAPVRTVPIIPTKIVPVVSAMSKGVNSNKFDDMEKIMLLTKKGRPSNKRKRFKKTHGPDFVENYDSSFEEPEPKCDYCLLTAAYNYHGKPEELLFCKDCNAKAHPSCMDYSAELAVRSRMSPWQCMDCKTCFVCEDSEDADSMLFCDACDKGYHMGCHTPKINEKPLGKWVCYQCAGERKRKNGSLISNSNNNNIGRKHLVLEPMEAMEVETPSVPANSQTVDGGAPGLPTPCESPVPEGEQQKQTFNYFTLHNESLNENKENTDVPDASEWTIEDVENYFRQAGFPEQATAFKDQEIDGKSLLLLKRSDVLSGLSIKLGPALKIYNHVVQLQTRRIDGHLIG